MIVDISLDKYKETQQDGTIHFTQEDEATHLLANDITTETLNRSVFKQEIRSYEISLWTLQDEFITVLKWSDSAHKGRIEEPKMKLNVDGTAELQFKIPMYIRVFQEKNRTNDDPRNMSRMIMKENPIWYNTQNGNLIESMRKLKVIFNKREPDEGVFEFLITKVTESHEEDQLYCEIESEGLAFHELGKIGYKCHLSEDAYILYIEELEKKYPSLSSGEILREYPSRINYWMEECVGIDEWPANISDVNPRKWYFRVEMDWSSFANGKNRSANKIYEEAYITSWEIKENESDSKKYIVPVKEEAYQEKYRLIDTSESNIYNITQTLAEKFGVFCKYEYGYDENYHIISRCIIFYNNFMKEHDIITINYPHKAKKIGRSMDGTDLTTKLFVRPIDDESTRRGTINIINSEANKMCEDYLLNFDYMRTCNGITEEQYQAINDYENDISIINKTLFPLQKQYGVIFTKIPELEGEIAILEESVELAKQQIEENTQLEQALVAKYGNGTDKIVIPETNPQITYIVESDNPIIQNYIDLSDDYKGIDPSTIVPYSTFDTRTSTCSLPYESFRISYDSQTGFPNRLFNISRYSLDSNNTPSQDGYGVYGEYTNITYEYAWSDTTTKDPEQWFARTDIQPAVGLISEIQIDTLKGGQAPAIDWVTGGATNSLNKEFPSANLTDDEKKKARYLWQKITYHYSKEFTTSNYAIYDFGDPDSSTFYNNWTRLYYCQDVQSGASASTPAMPTGKINETSSTVLNAWSTAPLNFHPNTDTTKYVYYYCWQKTKVSYKYEERFDIISSAGTGQGTHTNSYSAHNLSPTTDWPAINGAPNKIGRKYYTNELNSTDEWTSPKTDSIYNTFKSASGKVYLTFSYRPQLYYQQLVKQWTNKKDKDQKALSEKLSQLGQDNNDKDHSTGLYKTLYTLEFEINNYIEEKEQRIKEFEHMLGPALREGYWDAEDYSDYGDPKEVIFTNIDTNDSLEVDTGTNAVIGWDEEYFDIEEQSYYEYSIEETQIYYPCINLNTLFNSNTGTTLNRIKNMLNKLDELNNASDSYHLQFVFSSTQLSPALGFSSDGKRLARYAKTMVVGSDALLRFAKVGQNIVPVLVLVGAELYPNDEIDYMKQVVDEQSQKLAYPQFGIFSIRNENSGDGNNIYIEPYTGYYNQIQTNVWIDGVSMQDMQAYTLVYPHIKISSLDLKTENLDLFLRQNFNGYYNYHLNEYEDYAVLDRINMNQEKQLYESANYIAIKPEVFYKYGIIPGINNTSLIFDYYISNASTALYLDAKKVLDENSVPKVEYTVETNILDTNIMKTLYSRLAQIMMINDVELKFNNVFGYISGIELDLDKPEEDSIEVKNYKTKFEDLFSTIVAQTDAMKKNEGIIESIANGVLFSSDSIMETIEDSGALEKAISNYTDNPQLNKILTELWTEAGEILAGAQNTIDMAHNLNINNAAILGGFAERIQDALMPTITRGTEPPESFKAGDIFIQVDEANHEIGRYVGMMNSASGGTMTRTYDGTLAAITGSSLSVDAESGEINILAQNTINIKSGNSIYVAANDNVDIIGNKAVNIGGARINIAALGNTVANSGITMIADANLYESLNGQYSDQEDESYILTHLVDLIEPYKDIALPVYNNTGFRTAINACYIYNTKPYLNLGNNKLIEIIPNDSSWGVTLTNNQYQLIYNFIESRLGALSKVCIYPQRIEMTSSNIYMKGSNRILAVASLGTEDDTSVIDISATSGIFIGSNKSIKFYSGKINYNDATKTYTTTGSASVEINRNHILFGVSSNNNSAGAMELTSEHFILGIGAVTNASQTINGLVNSDSVGAYTGNAGMVLKKNYFGLAIESNNTRNAIIMNNNGLRLYSGNDSTSGSYMYLSGTGIDIGTKGHLFIDAENHKFIINSAAKNADYALYIADNYPFASANSGITFSHQYGLTIKGALTTTSLLVGVNGSDNYLSYSSNNGLYIRTKYGIYIGDTSSDSYFSYSSGKLNVKGSIYATSGYLGDWRITSNYLWTTTRTASGNSFTGAGFQTVFAGSSGAWNDSIGSAIISVLRWDSNNDSTNLFSIYEDGNVILGGNTAISGNLNISGDMTITGSARFETDRVYIVNTVGGDGLKGQICQLAIGREKVASDNNRYHYYLSIKGAGGMDHIQKNHFYIGYDD